MDAVLKYRGRQVTAQDVAFIRELVARNTQQSRRALSLELCRAWDWVQPNGLPCDGVCRALLLQLHRAGHIELPESRWKEPRPQARVRRQPAAIPVDESPLEGPLSSLGPMTLQQVRRTVQEHVVDALIARYHYLGAARPVGEHLKYLVATEGRPIACFCWSSAPRHLAPRDDYIGWTQATRKANIRFIAYQTRFLILPWVRVPHLASHLLGRMSRQLSGDWQRVYAHPIYFTETFVDPERNPGTCYRAANWISLGLTKGRGKDDRTMKPNRSLKLLFGYPLLRNFRERLCRAEGL
jgi:hypothetical protein